MTRTYIIGTFLLTLALDAFTRHQPMGDGGGWALGAWHRGSEAGPTGARADVEKGCDPRSCPRPGVARTQGKGLLRKGCGVFVLGA